MHAPETEQELLQRAAAIAGLTLEKIAAQCGLICPSQQRYAKGWVGQLLEVALGATAANLSEPDFQALNIELKTIPVNSQGLPQETTYVCTVPMLGMGVFEDSSVYKKLQRVLWIPIEAEKTIPLAQRRIGNPLLWSPNSEDYQQLRADWEELAEHVNLGNIASINAKLGKYLQIRPKAASGRERCQGIGQEGGLIQTLPRGFYLRTFFTRKILKQYYCK